MQPPMHTHHHASSLVRKNYGGDLPHLITDPSNRDAEPTYLSAGVCPDQPAVLLPSKPFSAQCTRACSHEFSATGGGNSCTGLSGRSQWLHVAPLRHLTPPLNPPPGIEVERWSGNMPGRPSVLHHKHCRIPKPLSRIASGESGWFGTCFRIRWRGVLYQPDSNYPGSVSCNTNDRSARLIFHW